jgi:hypothetical protein
MIDAQTIARAATLIRENKWLEAGRLLGQSLDPELALPARMCQDIVAPSENDKRRVLDLLELHAVAQQPPITIPPGQGRDGVPPLR